MRACSLSSSLVQIDFLAVSSILVMLVFFRDTEGGVDDVSVPTSAD